MVYVWEREGAFSCLATLGSFETLQTIMHFTLGVIFVGQPLFEKATVSLYYFICLIVDSCGFRVWTLYRPFWNILSLWWVSATLQESLLSVSWGITTSMGSEDQTLIDGCSLNKTGHPLNTWLYSNELKSPNPRGSHAFAVHRYVILGYFQVHYILLIQFCFISFQACVRVW